MSGHIPHTKARYAVSLRVAQDPAASPELLRQVALWDSTRNPSKRVRLARALLTNPAFGLLVLDDPRGWAHRSGQARAILAQARLRRLGLRDDTPEPRLWDPPETWIAYAERLESIGGKKSTKPTSVRVR